MMLVKNTEERDEREKKHQRIKKNTREKEMRPVQRKRGFCERETVKQTRNVKGGERVRWEKKTVTRFRVFVTQHPLRIRITLNNRIA